MSDCIPFTTTGQGSPGSSITLVPALRGYHIEVYSMFVSVRKLSTGGPYTDQLFIYGFEDATTGRATTPTDGIAVNFEIQLNSTAPQNFAMPVQGRTPPSYELTVTMTDASSGMDITGPFITVSGAYVKD